MSLQVRHPVPSVDRLSLQRLVCRCIVFHSSLLLKHPQESVTQILKSSSWWSSFCIWLNEFVAAFSTQLWWAGIHRFIGLFSMNPQETHPKVHRRTRKDTLEFCIVDFWHVANSVDPRTVTTLRRPISNRKSLSSFNVRSQIGCLRRPIWGKKYEKGWNGDSCNL